MTPTTLVIDRSFKGVGRIKRATGTAQGIVRKAMSNMLTALHQQGRLDILRAVRDGHLTLLEVYDAHRRHAINSLPLAGALHPLKATMEKWIASADVSPKHATSLTTSLNYFIAAKPDAVVNDLPQILEELRNTLGIEHARSFNLAKRAASRFISATLKRSHPLYAKVADVELRKVTPKRKRKPLSVQQMRNLFPDLTNHDDAIAWGVVTTGMRNSEYWGRWSVLSDRVHIDGTKTGGAKRDVPLILSPTVPRIHRRTWEDRIRERKLGITPYDLRRTYANWMEAAGIPRTRRKLYMGHTAGDVTGLYELHEVAEHLAADAEKLRHFVNLPTEVHTLKLEKEKSA